LIPVYGVYPSLPAQKLLGRVKIYPPLSLGAVISFAKKYHNGALTKKFRFLKELYVDTQQIRPVFRECGPGVFLFSSYIWSLPNNLELAKDIKRWDKRNITIFGGPSIPLKEKDLIGFLRSNPQVDICVRGEGEVTLAELLDRLGCIDFLAESKSPKMSVLKDVSGLAFYCGPRNASANLVYTTERKREPDLRNFPSPYLNGDFDGEDIPMWTYATLETNRGCPYLCSFCNWGGGVGVKVYKFPMRRVIDEINWLARNGIPRIIVCDANFGLFDRDIEIAKAVARAKREYGYPSQVILSYPRDQVERVFEIAKILTEAGVAAFGTISLQTLDPTVLNCANRRNVKIEQLTKLISEFRKEELPLATEFMIGLPGSTVHSVKSDLQFSFDNQLIPTKCYSTIALPNTFLTDDNYVKKYKIEVDRDGLIKSTYSFNYMDLEEMKAVIHAFRIYVSYGIFKYILWYIQLDHDIKAMEVIHDLTEFFYHPMESYPELSLLSRSITECRGHPGSAFLPLPTGGWDAFYDEARRFFSDRYGISDEGIETVFEVQKAVMPQAGLKLPKTIRLRHDFPSYYFENLNRDGASKPRKLVKFPEGKLEISDLYHICDNLSQGELCVASDIVYWELNTVMTSKNSVVYEFGFS
jgi:radical SAM superfamily enzyme YgiQ (UPF0313 family)